MRRRSNIMLAALLLAPEAFAQTSAPELAHTAAEVAGSNLEQSSHCEKNAPLRILANDSHLSILGGCSVITIVGSRNWISVQHARRIIAAGDRNTVLYDDGTTRVEDKGNANSVAPRWPQ